MEKVKELVLHWHLPVGKDDPVMRRIKHRIQADLTSPRWLLSEQYQWLLHNESKQYPWFSLWVRNSHVQYANYFHKELKGPHPSYIITPNARKAP